MVRTKIRVPSKRTPEENKAALSTMRKYRRVTSDNDSGSGSDDDAPAGKLFVEMKAFQHVFVPIKETPLMQADHVQKWVVEHDLLCEFKPRCECGDCVNVVTKFGIYGIYEALNGYSDNWLAGKKDSDVYKDKFFAHAKDVFNFLVKLDECRWAAELPPGALCVGSIVMECP